jgi:radical SAM protein with 4Fe4S-binding SPASM domain
MATSPDGPASVPPRLRYAILELTLRCNLRCLHCASNSGRKRPAELDLGLWREVVEDLSKLGRPAVDLMGGEVLLSPLVLAVGEALAEAGMPWGLLTNGWRLTRARARELYGAGCRGIGISLDGACDRTHDRIRGRRGSFERALRALEVIAELPLKARNRSVLTSVNAENLRELPAMGELLSDRFPGFRWQLNLTSASSARMPEALRLGPDGVVEVAEFLRKSRKSGAYRLALSGAHDLGYYTDDAEINDHQWQGCPAGIRHLGVSSDGTVKGCLALPDECGIGSVRERRLADLWQDDEVFRAYRHFDREHAGPNCRKCEHVEECRGGCRAYSLARTGLAHNHPDCRSRKSRPEPRRRRLPLATEPAAPYTGSLVSACIELTRRCNLRCLHCGSSAGATSGDELELEEFIPIFRDLRRLGGERVVLLGGEPLLHPDWQEVAEMARLFGLEVAFVTNGTRVTMERARRLASLCTHVGVSVDGAQDEVHDRLRGRAGARRAAWRAIERLRDAGAKVTVITTLWQANLGELSAMRKQLTGRSLVWQLQLAAPNGDRFPREEMLGPQDVLAVARFIAETRAAVARDDLAVAGGHSIGHHARSVVNYGTIGTWQGCPGGVVSVGIAADSGIKGCLSMGPAEVVGYLRERSLYDLWRDERSFSSRRRASRATLSGQCKECPSADTCLGGCPEMARAATGSATDNPLCLRQAESQGAA